MVRIKPPTVFQKLMTKLNLDETFTKKALKYKFDKIKENTFPVGGYNYMMDLLELPTTEQGYHILLVVVDLWSDAIDFEPLKLKTAEATLAAFKEIIKRKYLKLPKASIRSDNGGEFMGTFGVYLKQHKITQRFAIPYRHKQNANVESANFTLGRIFMTYLSNQTMERKEDYNEWTDIVPEVRNELNIIRHKDDGDPFDISHPIPYNRDEPLYKVGDLVIRKNEKPYDALGNIQNDKRWRQGDISWDVKTVRKILKVLNYPNNNRYVLSGLLNVSYAETEIKPSNATEELKEVKQILNHSYQNRKMHYQLWFKGQLKKDAKQQNGFFTRDELINTYHLQKEIDDYENKRQK
jgi:hypothetical protein